MKSVYRVLRDPAWCFLVVGGVVGLLLFAIMPLFTGIDEIAHFARTYQISEGRLAPQKSALPNDPLRKGSGVCLPVSVERELERHAVALYMANLKYVVDTHGGSGPAPQSATSSSTSTPAAGDGAPTSTTEASTLSAGSRTRECPTGRVYTEISTFGWYSPVPYAVGAVAFAVLRPLGASVDVLAYVGRAIALALYLGLVFWAIRRAPRSRWALCIAALLPVAMFQANSLSPDAFTTAAAILVLSSALRVMDRPPGPIPRNVVLEAVGLSTLLALSKPTYIVVALVYLVPLLDPRKRRNSWILLVPVAVGGLVSTVWQRATASLFVCDVRFFGIHTRPGDQARTIFTEPWRFLGASGRAFPDHGVRWLEDLVTIGGRIVDWPAAVSVIVALGFLVLACQQDRSPTRRLRVTERVGLLGVFAIGMLAVFGGWLVYCSPPGMHLWVPPHARLFMPLLPVLLVAVTPDGKRATRFGNAVVPPVLALVVFYAIWLTEVARSLR